MHIQRSIHKKNNQCHALQGALQAYDVIAARRLKELAQSSLTDYFPPQLASTVIHLYKDTDPLVRMIIRYATGLCCAAVFYLHICIHTYIHTFTACRGVQFGLSLAMARIGF